MTASSLAAKFDYLLKYTNKKNIGGGGGATSSGSGGGFSGAGGGGGVGGGGGDLVVGGRKRLSKQQPPIGIFSHSVFLPKLPAKLFAKSIRNNVSKETHYIGGFFIQPQDRPTDEKEDLVCHGDLLKERQIFLVTSPVSFSDTMKRVKTAENPYRDNNSSSSKPCKSALASDRVEQSSYARSRVSGAAALSRSNTSIVGGELTRRQPVKRFNSTCRKPEVENSVLSAAAPSQPSNSKTASSEKYNSKRLAEEWLEKNNQFDSKNSQPDIAIHALDFIWEFHSSILKNCDFLKRALESQSHLSVDEIRSKLARSKRRASRNNHIGEAKLDSMTHLFLNIQDPLINHKSFTVALKNFYHPEAIEIPGELAGGVLAAAHYLHFNSLRIKAVEKLAESLSTRTISNFYLCAIKFQEKKAIEACEHWLALHLTENTTNAKLLKQIPYELLNRVVNSNRLFTCDEYSVFEVLTNWIFFKLNPSVAQLPNQNILVAYFSSLNKTSSFFDQCPDAKELFESVRLNGINRSNLLETIEQMNIYPRPYLMKSMMEIQHSMENGGDMKVSRDFERTAIRHGFVIETDQSFFSETFSLYGFNFELVAEKKSSFLFQFYIQRLNTNDCGLAYQKTQIETVSLRNERRTEYSISVQYATGHEIVRESSGLIKHTFGRTWWQTTRPFQVDLTKNIKHLNCVEATSTIDCGASATSMRPGRDDTLSEFCPKRLFCVFSFSFPSDS